MPRLTSRALSLAFVGYVCALVLIPSIASAAFVNLGPAGDFNVFVFNDNTQSGSDAEGRVAVGGNALFGAFSIASSMGASTDNLIVGGNMTNSDNTLKGGLLVNGNVAWPTPTITGRVSVNGNANFTGGGGTIGTPITVGGTYSHPGYYPPATVGTTPLPFVFADVADYLTDLADYLAGLPINGITTNPFNNITMTGTDPTFNNFYITATDLTNGTVLNLNAPAGSTAVVNVDGAAANFDSLGINLVGIDKQHVLYNFHNATTLGMHSIGVLGSLLAPRADVNFGYGNIDGTLIAKNLTGPGESHHFPFEGELPPLVPEPSTLALATLALAALATRRN